MVAKHAAPAQAVHPVAVFKRGAALWQKNFAQLSAVFLVFYIPMLLVALAIQMMAGSKPSPAQAVLAIPLQVLAGAAGIWAAIALMLAAVQENRSPVKAMAMQALERFWPYVGASIVMGLVTAGPVLLSTLVTLAVAAVMAGPGPQTAVIAVIMFVIMAAAMAFAVILSLRFFLFGFACVLEKSGPIASLKRSWALTRRRLAPILGTSALVGLVFFVLMIPVFIAGLLAGRQPAQGMQIAFLFYSYAAYFVAVPLQTCVMVNLYRDLKEANP